ncbi:MAG: calcium:proton antiporter [Acetobacteraceae bacterium]
MRELHLPHWTWIAPLAGMALLAASPLVNHPLVAVAQAAALIACVLAAVHHAEVVAHRVGEPLGTVVLAVAVTVIEVGLIVSLMLTAGQAAAALARDTVFASIMIILNGMVGLCLLAGSVRHGEQSFSLYGVNATLATLAAISVITLVLPNATITTPGPYYSTGQLAFVAIAAIVLYGAFLLVQTVGKRDYFLPIAGPMEPAAGDAEMPDSLAASASAVLLLVCLGAVILLAKALGPVIEAAVDSVQAPKAVVGLVIALIVLLPEGVAALNAARANRLQTSLNLALGSAMASIGLTIPAVAAVSISTGWHLALGLDMKESLLLGLSLLVATLSLGTGRTIGLQGIVHLVIFAVYLFTAVVP